MPTDQHRKRVRHFHEPGDCHELTFSCYDRRPLLRNETRLRLLSRCVDRAIALHDFRLAAFVFMPEYVHLIVYPARPEQAAISELLKAIKRPFSYQVKQELLDSNRALLHHLTLRERSGHQVFRFWQAGPGYDRNLTSPGTVQAAIQYVHMNPVRRGLCNRAADWKWSSCRFFESETRGADAELPRIHGLPFDFLD